MKNGASLTVASLFAGIGGFERGMEAAGHSTLLQCELLPEARAVLRAHFPSCRRTADITGLRSLPSVNLVMAGFPCQDLSQAGKSVGIRGSQSSLIDFVFDLIGKKRQKPEWLLLENVPFMLQLNAGEAMRHLVEQVEKMGYRWAYRIVDTRSFGLPQRRRRVLFLASQTKSPSDVLLADDAESLPDFDLQADAHGFYWTEGNRGLGWTCDGVPTIKGSSGFSIPSPPAIWVRSQASIRTLDIRDGERLQGFPTNWTSPVESVLDTKIEATRWKLVGNAVSVPVAKWIGRRLVTPGNYESSNDKPRIEGQRWPTACWGENGRIWVSEVSEAPKRYVYRSLESFLRFPTKDLSLKATSGFFNRLQESGLQRPKEFDESLRKHIRRMSPQTRSHSKTDS